MKVLRIKVINNDGHSDQFIISLNEIANSIARGSLAGAANYDAMYFTWEFEITEEANGSA